MHTMLLCCVLHPGTWMQHRDLVCRVWEPFLSRGAALQEALGCGASVHQGTLELSLP